MSETNIGALTGSKTYTGKVDSTNIFDLYQFNIKSPGSFQLSLNGLTSNADVFLLNSRCRRRLKPRLHKQSLPPQTE